MKKIIYVTRAQVLAARELVRRGLEKGKPVREGIRKIAEAKLNK